jgi:hypothetical protein
MINETEDVSARRGTRVSMGGFGAQMLFLHGHIADPALARLLVDLPPGVRPRPRRRHLLALFGMLGCGAIRAFPH